MSNPLFACVHAREFPAQALLRLRADLRCKPIAVIDGRAPSEFVCSINTHAHNRGAVLNMTRNEAEAMDDLVLMSRSVEAEASARNVFLEAASNFSPRIEDVSSGATCACVLDISGTESLFGPPEILARNIRAALQARDLHTSIAVSANFYVARMMAAASRRILVVPAGEEAKALHPLSIRALDLPDEQDETLALWGIRTLGELAELPVDDLVARLGPSARVWRDLACGRLQHTMQPLEPAFELSEFTEFDFAVEQSDSFLFIAARMLDSLVRRATERAMAIQSLSIQMNLEGAGNHTWTVRPALPSTDRKFLLKLVQLEISAHPPQAAILAVTIRAEAEQPSRVQLGLFAPQTPEPSRLDVTVARLKALVGRDRVGSPALTDSHEPGAFFMEEFRVRNVVSQPQLEPPRLVLRRMRPPIPVRTTVRSGKPVAFRSHEDRFSVAVAYGPWRSTGNWWSNQWGLEEWDVLARNGAGMPLSCLLVRNPSEDSWQIEAFYD